MSLKSSREWYARNKHSPKLTERRRQAQESVKTIGSWRRTEVGYKGRLRYGKFAEMGCGGYKRNGIPMQYSL